ncbi:hypothetical protein J7382_06800 [Shimia sp. R11_0]|uniref:hypothetical protein n=1 Tax=Shimia sp. R11_0 TaxID=2821096 RepID=UPI001ADD1502|nr:hypothetical protein [Shimia sp. R11_0]MBO9477237.1 hypothetical protein [Shimia sp. R11_0]
MLDHVPVDETQFKTLLEHAERMRVMFGGIQWYGPAQVPGMPQSNLLHGEMFYSAVDFLDAIAAMRRYCSAHPNDHGLDHALIYVFDGREKGPKFHHYLWTPDLGASMQTVDYWAAVPTDYYACHAFDALMAQKKAVKVSTVVNAAFKQVRKEMGADGSDEHLKAALRTAVAGFIGTNQLIHSKRVTNFHSPSGGYTMIEHLGIYDRNPTWMS